MILYMGIDPMKEGHLMWIAKLAVLEALPDGWAEVIDTEGRTVYSHLDTGEVTVRHWLVLAVLLLWWQRVLQMVPTDP